MINGKSHSYPSLIPESYVDYMDTLYLLIYYEQRKVDRARQSTGSVSHRSIQSSLKDTLLPVLSHLAESFTLVLGIFPEPKGHFY